MESLYTLLFLYAINGKGNLISFLIGTVYLLYWLGVYFYRRYAKYKRGEEYDAGEFKTLFETLTFIGIIAGGFLIAFAVNYFSK